MLDNYLSWFFIIFSSEFRQNKIDAFETIMFLAIAHCFGFYNPKQLADFLGIPHQIFLILIYFVVNDYTLTWMLQSASYVANFDGKRNHSIYALAMSNAH
jgi:hypothetical protein